MYIAGVFREDEQFVGVSPELNVSSFVNKVEEARKSLREAVDLFLEECESMGTLEAVLRETGFHPDLANPQKCVLRTPILVEQVTL